ncbi:hypothetical protein U6A24_21720 [Aquimarina gracilis]|uniref:Lipoprotein n=1 Tax=Aquimarina gracilis TaxID=874422 RepID=A0ABU6A229_9FLAO|nr:hypothetical protein [Aquimarina gracilis]MEB3348110.1 hypothetical protein [Aquimarina gracilis]
MKKAILLIISISLLISCGKDKKKDEEPGLFEAIEGISDLNKMAKEAEEIEEESNKLLKATPISNDELKAFLPETLVGFSRKKFSVGNQFMTDVAMAEAEYEDDNGTMISLSVMDGAGETGSAMITLARLGFTRDFEEQSDLGYKKSVTVNGYKAIEEVQKDDYDNSENSKVDLLISNRFIVTLEGEIAIDQLKKGVKELNLNTLEQKANN